MTDEYRPDLVQASWERVRPFGDMFSARFYGVLFSVHPELRAKFPVAMGAQYAHLFHAVDAVAAHAHRLDEASRYLEHLGRRHAALAEPQDYDKVGGALLATFAHFDTQWDEQTADSVAGAYGHVAGVMRAAAEDLLTDPNRPDPTPRWYHVYGLKRLDAYSSRVMLEADEKPAHVTPLMWASVLGRPGWWTQLRPLEPTYAPPELAELVTAGHLIISDVVILDHRARALALARPGQRVAIAPEVNP